VAAAFVSLVSVVVAIFSARNAAKQTALAERQTELQRQTVEDAAQPYVWVDLRPDEGHAQLMRLVAVNQGATVATDVEITIAPPLPPGPNGNTPAGPSGRLASMPPGRMLTWTVGGAISELFDDAIPKRYRANIRAQGPYGLVELEYDLDLQDYAGAAQTAPGTLFAVAKSIDKLTSTLKQQS
jgi:hypothetical protein